MYDNMKSPAEMIRILPEEQYKQVFAFINLGIAIGCKPHTRYAHSNKYWRCVFSIKKPSRVLFTVECTEEWWRVKACLWNIDAYGDVFGSCSERIKNDIINAYDCKHCNKHCKGGAGFLFKNQQYHKCVGCCFYFQELSKDDWDGLALLIMKEHQHVLSA